MTRVETAEDHALTIFWRMSTAEGADRLDILKKFAGLVLERRFGDPSSVRIKSRMAQTNFHRLESECFCCRKERRNYIWHHVIQIQHGGSENYRNQVPLCDPCHADIHPWLPQWPQERDGFVRVGELVKPMFSKIEWRWKEQA